LSRTQAQSKQMVRELRTKTVLRPRIAVLGSRQFYCVHPEKDQWKRENASLDDKCIGLGCDCKYFENADRLAALAGDGLHDIEDLVKEGTEGLACPYYASRLLVKNAQVVFAPYSYLIDPAIRNACGIDLIGNVLIIDEAHNIESVCTDVADCTVTISSLGDCLSYLRSLDAKEVINLINLVDVFHELICIQKDHQFPEIDGDKSFLIWQGSEMHSYLIKKGINDSTISNCQLEFENLNKVRDQFSLFKSASDVMENILQTVCYLFDTATDCKSDFRIAFERRPSTLVRKTNSLPKQDILLNFWCLNSSVIFKPIADDCRSVILMSGTLSPIKSYSKELGVDFKYSYEALHVIQENQLLVAIAKKCPNGFDLKGDHRHSSKAEYLDGIGQSIFSLASKIPSGVLVFVPSGKMLSKFRSRWSESMLLSQIETIKHVFFENELGSSSEDIYSQYVSACNMDKGAILFCVYRGKMSEGIDFKNQLARGVICVGIPYPNNQSIHMKQLLKYHEEFSEEKGIMSKSDWYDALTYRALNQALGRCIRHQNDWGCIVFLDSRFSSDRINNLSKWVRTRVKSTGNFNELISCLDDFNEIQAQREREESKATEMKEQSMQKSMIDADSENLAEKKSNVPRTPTPAKPKPAMLFSPFYAKMSKSSTADSDITGEVIDLGSESEPMPQVINVHERMLWMCEKCNFQLFQGFKTSEKFTLLSYPLELTQSTEMILTDQILEWSGLKHLQANGLNSFYSHDDKTTYATTVCSHCLSLIGYHILQSKVPALESCLVCIPKAVRTSRIATNLQASDRALSSQEIVEDTVAFCEQFDEEIEFF
jgi:fanconi anemia group J protein